MPRDATIRGLNPGHTAEVRVARAWFWDGYYSRRSVVIDHHFGIKSVTLTDLDIIGFSFDEALHCYKQIGEVKAGKSKNTPKPLDRAFWMHGVKSLTGADRGEFTTALNVSEAVRSAASSLGIAIQEMSQLELRESRLRIESVLDVGSQGIEVAILREEVESFSRGDRMMEQAFRFLTTEVWSLNKYDAVKRTIGLIRGLRKVWPPASRHEERRVLAWFFAESISVFGLHLAMIAEDAVIAGGSKFSESAQTRLSAGDVPYHQMMRIADDVDRYVSKLLQATVLDHADRIQALGAFRPTPPNYSESLIELVVRMAQEARAVARLPRQLDAVIFERLVHERDVSEIVGSRLGLTGHTQRHIRLVAAFLEGWCDLPVEVAEALKRPLFARKGVESASVGLSFTEVDSEASSLQPQLPEPALESGLEPSPALEVDAGDDRVFAAEGEAVAEEKGDDEQRGHVKRD